MKSSINNIDSLNKIVNEIYNEIEVQPIDLLGIGDEEGEWRYLEYQKPFYIRTVRDILDYYMGENITDFSQIRVYEIGSFLGVVSIALSRLGFNVLASEIPIFYKNKRLKERYQKHNIQFSPLDLSNIPNKFAYSNIDYVIMCETLEHLNFNPLPSLKFVHSILKMGGLISIALPNLTRLDNRIKLMLGYSIHNPIEDFFKQLDKTANMVVGLHWREYTTNEVKEMLERLGFMIKKQYLFTLTDLSPTTKLSIKGKIKRILFPGKYFKKIIINKFPNLKENQRTIAAKVETQSIDFHFYDEQD